MLAAGQSYAEIQELVQITARTICDGKGAFGMHRRTPANWYESSGHDYANLPVSFSGGISSYGIASTAKLPSF